MCIEFCALTRDIVASKDQCGTDVTLVLEQMAFQFRHSRDNSSVPPQVQRQDFKLPGDHRGHCLRVSGGASTTAPNFGSNVMDFLAILVAYRLALGGTSICTKHDAIFVH